MANWSNIGNKEGKKLVDAQAKIPAQLYEEVRRRAHKDCDTMASIFRRWIIKGYEEDKRDGKF